MLTGTLNYTYQILAVNCTTNKIGRNCLQSKKEPFLKFLLQLSLEYLVELVLIGNLPSWCC